MLLRAERLEMNDEDDVILYAVDERDCEWHSQQSNQTIRIVAGWMWHHLSLN